MINVLEIIGPISLFLAIYLNYKNKKSEIKINFKERINKVIFILILFTGLVILSYPIDKGQFLFNFASYLKRISYLFSIVYLIILLIKILRHKLFFNNNTK